MCGFAQPRSAKEGVERRSIGNYRRGRKEIIKGLSRYVQSHKTNVNEASADELLS